MRGTVILMLLFCACSGSPANQGKQARDQLVTAYADLLTARAQQERLSLTAADSAPDTLPEIFLTPEAYRSAVRYLNEKPDRWNDFFIDVRARLPSAEQKTDPSKK